MNLSHRLAGVGVCLMLASPVLAQAVGGLPAGALWDGRKIVPFKAIDSPPMVDVAEADFMKDSEYVIGVAGPGENRAYPTRFIAWHHIINDDLGKADAGAELSVAVTYCSVCNTGLGYDRRLDGRVRNLDFYGLCNGVVALCDRETESPLPQVSGTFVSGPLSGKSLRTVPVLDTTWGQWKKLHPDTRVMSPETEFKRFYRPAERAEPRGYDRFPAPFFKPTVSRGDLRLKPFEKILGVTVAASETEFLRRAYPIQSLVQAGGVVNDTLGTTSLVVLLDLPTTTAVARNRKLDGRELTFETRKAADGTTSIFDKETGSRWSIEGRAEGGPLAGKALEPVANHLSQWYGWAAFFPETSIYGRTDAPQPGNPFEGDGKAP